MDIPEIISIVKEFPANKVTITGGEPLLQREELYQLMCKLVYEGYCVSVETNGSLDLFKKGYHTVGSWVVDYKLPSSRMHGWMKWSVYEYLRVNDFIKFVIADERDFQEAIIFMENISTGAKFAFSPCFGKLEPARLLSWMEDAKLSNAILNLQLHKYIWPDEKSEER